MTMRWTKLFEDCSSAQLRLLFDSQNYSVFGYDYAVDKAVRGL